MCLKKNIQSEIFRKYSLANGLSRNWKCKTLKWIFFNNTDKANLGNKLYSGSGDRADIKEKWRDGWKAYEKWREGCTSVWQPIWKIYALVLPVYCSHSHGKEHVVRNLARWGQEKDKSDAVIFIFPLCSRKAPALRKWSYIGSCDPLLHIHTWAMICALTHIHTPTHPHMQ